MTRPRYIASCSGGKDSVATILLAAEKNEPLDEVIYSEVMFDQEISGEVPEHRDFIHQKLKRFVENELGCKFTVLRSDKLTMMCSITLSQEDLMKGCSEVLSGRESAR